jgi:hypothetical protein
MIPKINCKTTAYEMVFALNEVLPSEVDDFAELERWAHCATLIICQVLDCKVIRRDEINATHYVEKEDSSAWK